MTPANVKPAKNKKIPLHEWTNNTEKVLVVRFVNHDGRSYKGFQHPLAIGESVVAPDWNTRKECGGGIHGWAWGLHLGWGKECDWSALWQVYEVSPRGIIPLEGKVKFRTGRLVCLGKWWEVLQFVLSGQAAWVHHNASGSASATDEHGSASATGESSTAIVTATDGMAQTGEFGCIALAWWNPKEDRREMHCSLVGEGHPCKAFTWYKLDPDGIFVEVAQ